MLRDKRPHPRHPAKGAHPGLNMEQQNVAARNLIYNRAKPIQQRIGGAAVASVLATPNNLFSFNPFQIGLLVRFIVEVTCTINNTGAGALTLTPNGADNLIQNIQFNDFAGNPRHNCSGRTLSFVEAAKYARTPGAAQTSDSVSGFGSVVASNAAPATIANGGTGTVTRVFEIPVTVDEAHDMAGAMWLGVNNQSTLLKLLINAAPIGPDPLQAIYTGTSGTMTALSINVYQDYWTDIPKHKGTGKNELPDMDMTTAYMIQEFNSGIAFSANQESFWSYPTFSEILGTYLSYDNTGTTLNAGTDIAKLRTVISNLATIIEGDPNVVDRWTRDQIGTSMPRGSYGFFTREHPWNVDQYPSLQLAITPTSAPAGTYCLVGTELLRRSQFLEEASGVGGA